MNNNKLVPAAHKLARALALAGAFLLPGAAHAQTALPGIVQAETYANMSGIALETSMDTGGGTHVGFIDAGDWMSYFVNPSASGWYTVGYRIASLNGTGQVVLSNNGQELGPVIALPATGGMQAWQTVTTRLFLPAGAQTLTLNAKGGGFNLNWIQFTKEPVQPLPLVQQSGKYWVDSTGKRLNLRGTNLGNWLAMEFWMMGATSIGSAAGDIPDQCTLENTLTSRFGAAEKDRLLTVFRDNWITPRDFDNMAAMGMNVIRVPFLHSVIENEAVPYSLRPDAWKYLDFAVDEAEKRGMYVILDLHGAAGGQAAESEQHDGCIGAAELWTNTTYQDRTKWLWGQIAAHYKNRSAVLAYDLLNEPWGTDAATLANYAYKLAAAVRNKDPYHVILLPGHNTGIAAYGNPRSRGLTNAAFWMHFYPGLWGWKEVSGATAQANMYQNWLHCATGDSREVCPWDAKLSAVDSPFLVGEFQPWTLMGSYGGQNARKAFDVFNALGWAGTSWSYKTTSQAGRGTSTSSWGWGMVSNSNGGGGYGTLNVSTAPAADIEAWFRNFGTQPLVRNSSIMNWMNWQPTVGQRIEAEMFQSHSGMQVEVTSDTGGGFNVGHTDNGDWMSYPVTVPATGAYTVQFRVANNYAGGKFALKANATELAVVTVPNTGGWQSWQTVTATVNLTAGPQTLTIQSKVGGWNMNWWQLTKL